MLFFWKKKNVEMLEDLKVIEERLRSHTENTPGPTEEFRGRLESRLGLAWNQREWGITRPRYFAFVPQLAIACAVLVLAFVSADWTTRSFSVRRDTTSTAPVNQQQPLYDVASKEEIVPQKLFSTFAAPLRESAQAPKARTLNDFKTISFGQGSSGTASSMTATEEVSNETFLVWFVVYLFSFVIIAITFYLLLRKRT